MREALQDAGIEMRAKTNRNFKFPIGFLTDDRRVILALRNTFRRPLRMWLSLGTLAAGGAMLLAGSNAYSSLVQAVNDATGRRTDDLEVSLLAPARDKDELAGQVKQIPGVKAVEAWGNALVSAGLSNDHNQSIGTNRHQILAPPAGSEMMQPKIIEGRWLAPEDMNAVVVNRILRDTEKNFQVGETLNLIFGGKQTPVKIVGVTEEIGERGIYTNPATLTLATGLPENSAGALRVAVEPGQENQVAARLEQVLADNNLLPVFLMTRQALRQ